MTEQPKWKCVGHIGDVDPIAFGGGFVYIDETGVYPPELAYFDPASDEQWHKTEGKTPVEIYRLTLDPPRFKTLTDKGKYAGIFSSKGLRARERGDTWEWYNEWFVDHLDSVAASCGITKFQLLRMLFSKDAMERAHAYGDLIGCLGAHEFDQYPLTMTEDEAYLHYAEEMKLARRPPRT